MGCDYNYNGCLPDVGLQEKVIAFVRSEFEIEPDRIVIPEPQVMLPTIIDAGRVQTFERLYPFDFFGFIRIGTPQLLEQWQWVFDRSAGGRLVRFLRLPDQIRSHPPEQCEAVRPAESMGCHLKLGGYHRVSSGDIHVPLLLNVIQMRWWPDLFVQDDWKRFENIKALIMKYGLTEILLDESLSFGACLEALSVEHNRRNEP